MSIARHHTEWRRLLDISGPFLSLPVLTKAFPHGLEPHEPGVLERLRLAYDEWHESQEGQRPDPQLHRQWVRFVMQEVLGHPDEVLQEGQTIPQGLKVTAAEHHEDLRPDLVIVNPNGKPGAGKPRLLVNVLPFGAELEKALPGVRWKESPAGRMAILLRGLDVRVGLITNGEQWMLVDAPREQATGFTTWQAWLWLDEHVTLRAFRTLLSPSRFFNVPENETLEALLQESAERQQEVTDQLGRQVRRAVEILVQALDRADRESGGPLLRDTPEKEVYEAAVTFMMRLVFLFCAEERGLFPLDDEQYATHYAASTLSERLREAAEQWGEEVLERRTDAWQRLLATFRAVHGGVEHEDMLLPPYGGDLFDPDRYPFLEGRPRGTKWRQAPAQPQPIHNRTVLHLLEALQLLQDRKTGEAQRLSFLHLDIEQIGHVYEGLLDHTVKRATELVLSLKGREADEPEIELPELESLSREGKLLETVADLSYRSVLAVDTDLKQVVEPDAEHRLLVAADNDRTLYDRVRPFAALIREDVFGRPVIIPRGSLYATQGSDRRTTGTHYTPRSLTEPIVQYTLEPLVYLGPAEGKLKDQWTLKPARDILKLKICDMACGSGAFLVQACRYLSERLVESWEDAEAHNPGRVVITPEGDLSEARPTECIIPRDSEERLAVARRLIADRCLYGVDVNEMAVEMAKLSLWLVTLQKGRPFTFLNHALKCGDSLLGVTDVVQIGDFDLHPTGKTPPLFLAEACRTALAVAQEKRRSLEAQSVIDIRDAERKAALLEESNAAVEAVRVVGDLLSGLALGAVLSGSGKSVADLEGTTRLLRQSFDEDVPLEIKRAALRQLNNRASTLLRRAGVPERRPFHWSLEFPEVMGRDAGGGFDGVVGNPPFMYGTLASTALGEDYLGLLRSLDPPWHGKADLVVGFFKRAARVTRPSGTCSLIATSSLIRGETLDSGLRDLIARGFVLYQARSPFKWPGSAKTEVVFVSFAKKWAGQIVLDGRAVPGLSLDLRPAEGVEREPQPLSSDACPAAMLGVKLSPANREISFAEFQVRSANNPLLGEVYLPVLGGAELYGLVDLQGAPRAIDPSLLGPAIKANPSLRAALPQPLVNYQHSAPAKALREEMRARGLAFACGETAVHLAFRLVPTEGFILKHKLIVFPARSWALFGILQSDLHCAWAWRWGLRRKKDLVYSPKRCADTFPLPAAGILNEDSVLLGLSRQFHVLREEFGQRTQQGMTAIYNRFHDPAATDVESQHLRDAHRQMDETVARAYGWQDLNLGHGFHETPLGVRFTIGDAARREVLERLVVLNHARYADARLGLQGRGGTKARPTGRNAGSAENSDARGLLDEIERDS